MTALFHRHISRKLKGHNFVLALLVTCIFFVWCLVFTTTIADNAFLNHNTSDNQKGASDSSDKTAEKVFLDDQGSKETDQLIYIDDEVVSVDVGGGILSDNVFQNIVTKISQFNPNVSIPFSNTFSEQDTTTELKPNSLGYYIKKSLNIGGNPDDWDKVLSKKSLESDYLIVSDRVKQNITASHKGFIDYLNEEKFLYPDFYHGDGIVITGGGKYSLQAFSVITVIRNMGTTLPIEVLIPSDYDQDKAFCKKLDTDFKDCKCIYLDDIFEKSYLKEHKFHAFQYKSLALMASSFQNVLLLDADDYPLKNIDDIFDNQVFQDTGMIVWPDFWRRTTHPFYYESAGVKIDLTKRLRNFYNNIPLGKQSFTETESEDLPYHDFAGTLPDPSSETGEFLIDKKKHWKSLILSLYYNIHGPNVFYHLFSQYAAGQGDKETFLAAAHMLKLPYYQVYLNPSIDLYFEPKEDAKRSVAYYQKDFRKDYEIKKRLASKPNVDDISSYFDAKNTESDSLFAHCNLPKFDAVAMAEKDDFTKIKTGTHFRAMTNKKCLQGMDLEKIVTEAYYQELCQKDQTLNPFNYLIEKDFDSICLYWRKRKDLVKKTSE